MDLFVPGLDLSNGLPDDVVLVFWAGNQQAFAGTWPSPLRIDAEGSGWYSTDVFQLRVLFFNHGHFVRAEWKRDLAQVVGCVEWEFRGAAPCRCDWAQAGIVSFVPKSECRQWLVFRLSEGG